MPGRLSELKGHRKLVGLTAYDAAMAFVLKDSGVDFLLVGDSLGMVVYGQASTHFVTLDDMIRHTQAVCRGYGEGGLVVTDLPIATCETPEQAVASARRVVEEAGVHAVKIEGRPEVCRAVVESGVEVMGHVGLKPQEVSSMKVQGRHVAEADAVLAEAIALQAAGCFAVVVECVPATLGQRITETLTIPTIGIGAGPHCDGQILVTQDLIGLSSGFKAKFVRRYADVGTVIQDAVRAFQQDVFRGAFPSEKESY